MQQFWKNMDYKRISSINYKQYSNQQNLSHGCQELNITFTTTKHLYWKESL